MFKTSTELLVAVFLFFVATGQYQVMSLNLSYPVFPPSYDKDIIRTSDLQVSRDFLGNPISNMSGRIFYMKSFRLWNKKRTASFNSTFVFNINLLKDGGGEGMAFIMTKESKIIPEKSGGQWLGIVNAKTNGSSNAHIVAIEFDAKKSFSEDIDGNHVGLDINSVYSKLQVSLNSSDINLVNSGDITATVLYDGKTKTMSVSVFKGNRTQSSASTPVMSVPIDLSQYLPSKIYLGFSSSSGINNQLNCAKAWYFYGTDLDSTHLKWPWIVISVLSVTMVLLLSGLGTLYYMRKKWKISHNFGDGLTIQGIETGLGPKKMKLKDIKTATSNFNPKYELGRGGFGIVYKGTMDGNHVAVKRIINTPQGKQNLIAEVTIIGSLHHKNLVKLIGWCYKGGEFLLVYEYMSNGSLDRFIYANDEKLGKEISVPLSWERRHNIIFGVAQALDYLHNECAERVLHRDIKPSNIMLDSEFNARLGDFGLARMFKLSEKTHHSTKEIAGTPGYMAPEIFHTGRTTAETDIFSFGILTLVIACGKNSGVLVQGRDCIQSIIDWVWERYKSETVITAIDPRLNESFDNKQAEHLLILGLACCHPNPHMRPSIKSILQVLIGEAQPPFVPFEKPLFVWPASPPLTNTTQHASVGGGLLTSYTMFSPR